MKLFTLKTEQWIPLAPEQLFPFFAAAENLERLTPPWLQFRIATPGVEMRCGAQIDYRLKLQL
jgi:ligand-binding SRPBCC domain-containing protein